MREKADALREAIEAYLGDVDAADMDTDDLSWTLVDALRPAEAAKSPTGIRPNLPDPAPVVLRWR